MTEYDPSNEEQVKERKAKSKFDQRAKERFLRDALATRPGRDFFWDFLCQAGIFHSSFNASNAITAFNEGRRDMGLRLLADITKAAPDAYLTMIKESEEGESRNV